MTAALFFIHGVAIFLILYHHIIYPLLLTWLTKGKHPGGENAVEIAEKDLPGITILIPAYNEARWIADKVLNLTILDYPQDKLNILILCDGCTDNTVEIAKQCQAYPECQKLNLQVIEFPTNRGKIAVINEGMKLIRTELVAMSDVSALISIDGLKLSAQMFLDPEVGVVNSHYKLYNNQAGEQSYWLYQSKIKQQESLLFSTLGAHGAFYIFRSKLFTELEHDTINDDFILPMRIVKQGFKVKQLKDVHALELEASCHTMNQQRRKRISAGNVQQVVRLKSLLRPKYKQVAFLFASGKALRVVIPFLMIITYLSNAMLLNSHPIFVYEFILQNLFYLLLFLELRYEFASHNRYVKMVSYLFRGHLSGLVGALDYMIYRSRKPWKKV